MIRVDPATVTPAPPPPAGPGTDASAPARALIERQLAMLARLAEIGMEIAEAAGRQATSAMADCDGAGTMRDPALVYARTARAVRLTIALQSRLVDDLAALDRAADLAETERKTARRTRLRRLVERAVEAEHGTNRDEIERLSWEAREHLGEADLDADLEGLSVAEVVARICHDLGLPPERTARILAAAGPLGGPPGPSSPDARSAGRPAPAPDRRPSQAPSAHARAPPH